MQSVSQEIQYRLNYIFETVIPNKNYQDIEAVFETITKTSSDLTNQQKRDLAAYIKCMDTGVIDRPLNSV